MLVRLLAGAPPAEAARMGWLSEAVVEALVHGVVHDDPAVELSGEVLVYRPGRIATLPTAVSGAASGEPVPRKPRRTFTADRKAAILCRHHVDDVPVHAPGEANDPQTRLFYDLQRQLFENAANARQPAAPVVLFKALEAKVEAPEKHVAKKDAVIAWVTEEYVKPRHQPE